MLQINNSILEQGAFKVVEAIRKDDKTIVDAERIYEYIEQLEFFRNLFNSKDVSGSKENCLELCCSLGYEVYDRGICVFREGDASNQKFYVILSGEIAVVTNKNFDHWLISEKDRKEEAERMRKQQEEAETKQKQEEDFKALELSRLSRIQEEQRSLDSPKKKKQHRYLRPKSIETKFTEELSFNQSSLALSSYSPGRVSHRPDDLFSLVDAMSDNSPVVKVPRKSGFVTAVNVKKFVKNLSTTVKSRQISLFDDEEIFHKIASKFGHISKFQGKGSGFGEIALGDLAKVRTATILCKQRTELLTIDAAIYNNFIRKDHERRSKFILSALSTANIMIETLRGRNLISYIFEPKVLSESDVLTNEGEVPSDPRIFIIESGVFRVERKYMLDLISPLKKEEVVMTQEKWVTLCDITPGTFAGEELLFQNHKNERYEYKITVTSKKASVLIISKQNFKKNFPNLEGLKKFYKARKAQRSEIFEKLKSEGEKNNFIDPHNFLASNSSLTPYMSKQIAEKFQKKKDNQLFSQLIQEPANNIAGSQKIGQRTQSAGALTTLVNILTTGWHSRGHTVVKRLSLIR